MNGRIPDSFIAEVVQRTDLAALIGQHVPLRKRGREFVGLCPFHNEKTPSFTVSPSKRIFHCFGCGASGDAVRFLMEHGRMAFLEAVERLAKDAGLEMPQRQANESPADRARRVLTATLAAAAEHYRRLLAEHPQAQGARDGLQRRGISQDSIERYRLGFAPSAPTLVSALSPGIDERRLLEAGLLAKSERDPGRFYERFRNRIMFPIRERAGRVIGFGGRALDANARAKYLNSPETPAFHKRRVLYGLHETRTRRHLEQLVIVEGYLDVIALDQYSEQAAVASLGTALTIEQLELAFGECPELVVCFDGDNAGHLAAEHALTPALRAMRDGRSIRFVSMPRGEDPDSYVRQHGAEAFAKLAAAAPPLSDFLFQTLSKGLAMKTPEGTAQLTQRALPLLAQLRPGIYAETLRRQLSERCGLPIEVFERSVRARDARPASPSSHAGGRAPVDAGATPIKHAPPSEEPPPLDEDGIDSSGMPDARWPDAAPPADASGRSGASPTPDEGVWAERALGILLLRPGLARSPNLQLPDCARAHPSGELLRRGLERLASMPGETLGAFTKEETAAWMREQLATGDGDGEALSRAADCRGLDIGDAELASELGDCLAHMAAASESRARRVRLDAMPEQAVDAQRDELRATTSRRQADGGDRTTLNPDWLARPPTTRHKPQPGGFGGPRRPRRPDPGLSGRASRPRADR